MRLRIPNNLSLIPSKLQLRAENAIQFPAPLRCGFFDMRHTFILAIQEWMLRHGARLRLAAGGTERARLGIAGEQAAERFLRVERGMRIVARNWSLGGRNEIDLVARDGDVLVFVEVRTRAAHARIGGYESVTPRKRRVLRRAVRAYLRRLRPEAAHTRFDIVEVRRHPDGRLEVLHYEGVPLGI